MLRFNSNTVALTLAVLVCIQSKFLFAENQQVNDEITSTTILKNIENMDKDHDGMVTVFEVRTFLEAKHGKGYQSQVLDDMESSAAGKSCSSPFSKPLY